jgi:hypothetical protein
MKSYATLKILDLDWILINNLDKYKNKFVTGNGEIIKQFRKAREFNKAGRLDKLMSNFHIQKEAVIVDDSVLE